MLRFDHRVGACKSSRIVFVPAMWLLKFSSMLKIRHYLHHQRVPTHPSAQRTLTTRTKKWSVLLLQKLVTPRGRYNSYTPEERAQIGKYTLENGNTRVARHFSKVQSPNSKSPICSREWFAKFSARQSFPLYGILSLNNCINYARNLVSSKHFCIVPFGGGV